MSRIGRKGGVSASPSVVSHADNLEVLLIRISHWLWKWYRAEGRPTYLDQAIRNMAFVKFEYREPARKARAEATERIRKVRRDRKPQR